MMANWGQSKQFLLNLITKGKYETYDIEVTRKIIIFNIVTIIGFIFLVLLGTITYFNNIKYLWQIDYILGLILLLDLIYTQQSQNYVFGIYTAVIFYTLLCYYLMFTGGAYHTGYVWYYTYPFIACVGLGSRKGAFATAILIIPTLIFFAFNNHHGIMNDYSPVFIIRFTCSFFMISASAYFIERIREDTQQRLEDKNVELNKAMTDLKISDEKLHKASDELENRVEERTQQLTALNSQLLEEMNERRQVETSLQQSEEKYRLITEYSADVITIMDMNLRFTYVSPSITRIRGFTPEEVLTQKLEQILTPESLQAILTVFEEEMKLEAGGTADPNRTRFVETEQYRIDGSTVWLEVSLSFLRGNDGKPVGIVAVARDMSERKRVEQLEKQLQEAQKLESIGTLAGGIAHDFNNLLMGIQGNAILMKLDLDVEHPHYERLDLIEQQVASGADLTRQLLGFARKGRYEVKPANMNDIIESTLSMFVRTKKEISIDLRLENDLWPVKVDRGQIEQVLMNLYVNAAQAMPEGGEIILRTENVLLDDRYIKQFAIKQGKCVKLSISDTGTGMEESILKRIFDPFFTTKEMGRGTGLGLAIVYGIIKGHEGMIEVASHPGKGTTFYIHLPATDEVVVSNKIPSAKILTGKETILLVDDEKMVLNTSNNLLSSLGYKVYMAESGPEAIAVYQEKTREIDLIILDMVMPGISGGETFDRLRAINPNARVLLSSGYSLDSQALQILERGCNSFIQKPYGFEKLSNKIREVLND
ncbi:MAG: PAS domain S-box protein [Smithella sp.]